MALAGAAVVGYLLGSFPTAVVVTSWVTRGRIDIRAVGSRNPGGLNTARVIGKAWGALVMLIDGAKGFVAAWAGFGLAGGTGAYAAATAAVAGHVLPLFTRFRGGRGVATSLGAILVVFPAFVPIDVLAAGGGALTLRNAKRTMWLSSAAWVGAALSWWLADLPNLWGPAPTVGLLVFSLVGTGLILAKFQWSR
jgi:glycerol-3-phosphate acyltransferase PlsY